MIKVLNLNNKGWGLGVLLLFLGVFALAILIIVIIAFGIIIASIVNMFFYNYTANLIISIIGVIIFVGLVAYDTQKIKQLSLAVADGQLSEEEGKKGAIIGALTLYLDFINLFLYILRLFGNRK